MSFLHRTFLSLVLVALVAAAQAAPVSESPALAGAFERAGVTGTFVMFDPGKDSLVVHNPTRARTRFVPASTFKIVNSLIGLETGAVADVDVVLPYGGKPQPIAAWEHDMSLRDAIKISNVPVYQELARRIGLARMKAWVGKFGYGNGEIGNVVDRFWLDGPLEVSAVEQVEFLRRLAAGELPVSPTTLKAVQEITLQKKTETSELHGKTGWAMVRKPALGWYVGWVKRGSMVHPFALNIDISTDDVVAKRIPLAEECLRLLGAL
jgi:beta-lactamase class D OXA-50